MRSTRRTTVSGSDRTPYKTFDSADELRAAGTYQVVTPDEAVRLVEQQGGMSFKPLMGGLPPELGWESLALFENEVLPRPGT